MVRPSGWLIKQSSDKGVSTTAEAGVLIFVSRRHSPCRFYLGR